MDDGQAWESDGDGHVAAAVDGGMGLEWGPTRLQAPAPWLSGLTAVEQAAVSASLSQRCSSIPRHAHHDGGGHATCPSVHRPVQVHAPHAHSLVSGSAWDDAARGVAALAHGAPPWWWQCVVRGSGAAGGDGGGGDAGADYVTLGRADVVFSLALHVDARRVASPLEYVAHAVAANATGGGAGGRDAAGPRTWDVGTRRAVADALLTFVQRAEVAFGDEAVAFVTSAQLSTAGGDGQGAGMDAGRVSSDRPRRAVSPAGVLRHHWMDTMTAVLRDGGGDAMPWCPSGSDVDAVKALQCHSRRLVAVLEGCCGIMAATVGHPVHVVPVLAGSAVFDDDPAPAEGGTRAMPDWYRMMATPCTSDVAVAIGDGGGVTLEQGRQAWWQQVLAVLHELVGVPPAYATSTPFSHHRFAAHVAALQQGYERGLTPAITTPQLLGAQLTATPVGSGSGMEGVPTTCLIHSLQHALATDRHAFAVLDGIVGHPPPPSPHACRDAAVPPTTTTTTIPDQSSTPGTTGTPRSIAAGGDGDTANRVMSPFASPQLTAPVDAAEGEGDGGVTLSGHKRPRPSSSPLPPPPLTYGDCDEHVDHDAPPVSLVARTGAGGGAAHGALATVMRRHAPPSSHTTAKACSAWMPGGSRQLQVADDPVETSEEEGAMVPPHRLIVISSTAADDGASAGGSDDSMSLMDEEGAVPVMHQAMRSRGRRRRVCHEACGDGDEVVGSMENDDGSDGGGGVTHQRGVMHVVLKAAPRLPNQRDMLHSVSGTARKRIRWTEEEEEALKQGFNQYGAQWATILQEYKAVFVPHARTQVDLKDKWRNMQKYM